jgi:tetrahydromethanopterin S-methyltransferase subunit F
MKVHGCDPTKWGIIRLDNVQQYIRQRDLCIGRENKMQIGIAATHFETEGFVPGTDNLDDK